MIVIRTVKEVMKKGLILSGLLVCCLLGATAQQRTTYREYIEKYKLWAIEDQDVYGVPASITMAQGLLESDSGNSRLATEGNNHFGIKCKAEWRGETISHDDDAPGECFRKYGSAEESYRDHSVFLDNSARYSSLFELQITDYKGWAHGLKAAGYATNPKYAEMLIKIIEENKLYLLDTAESGLAALPHRDEYTPVVKEPDMGEELREAAEKIDVDNYTISIRNIAGYAVYANNGSEFVLAKQGDTYEQIAARTGISQKSIRKYNDVAITVQPKTGEQVYLRAKGNRATNGKLMHVTKNGETMHSISQIYGIKTKRLAKLNNRSVDSPISEGQQIRLM